MAITRSTISDSAGTRYKINVSGQKYSGTASGGTSTSIESTALSGSVEQNIIYSGTGVRNTYNPGNGSRTRLYEAAGTFLTAGVMPSNLVTNTANGTVYDSNIRGAWWQHSIWLNSTSFPTSSTGFDIHGFCKVTPTDWTQSYQWNLIYIHTGTGAGQVRLIKAVTDDGTTVRLWTFPQQGWTITPDNTSQFYILYSPLDIHHESVAQGWNLTSAHYDLRSQVPVSVELAAELSVGASSATYFGYADLYFWGSAAGGQWGWGSYAAWLLESNAVVFFGEGDYQDDIPIAFGQKALVGGKAGSPWSNSVSAGFSKETGAEVYNSNSTAMGSASFTQTITALAYTQMNWYGLPYADVSTREFVWYYGGTWGGPIYPSSEVVGGVTTNKIIISRKGQPYVSGAEANFAGHTWLGANTGESGDYFTEQRNTNLNIVGNFQDAASRDCDYWGIYPYSDFEWQWVEKKSLDITVIDADSGEPIEDVIVRIKNQNGITVSEQEIGAVITANMTNSQTAFATDLREKFSTVQLLRIDNEYMLNMVNAFSGPGNIYLYSRSILYPSQFPAKIHKYNTANFDPKVYVVKAVETDASGQIPTQWLSAFTMVADSTGSGYPSQVTVDGVNYTCNTIHQATAGNKPPNASYWNVSGDEGFPWEAGKYYTTGAGGARSWVNHGPFTITIQKPGYEPYSEIFDPTIDTEATAKIIQLKFKRFIEQRSV